MKRREFLEKSQMVALLGLAGLANHQQTAFAENNKSRIRSEIVISNNHGHQLNLSEGQLLQELRKSLTEGPIELNIQGESGHPHSLILNAKGLLELFIEGKLEISSSQNSGHSHLVTLTMDVEL